MLKILLMLTMSLNYGTACFAQGLEEDDAGVELETSEEPVSRDELTPAPEPAPIPAPAPTPTTPQMQVERYKPSEQDGEKVFDWSKYQNAKEVPHPFAKKGLIRITKDKTYIYKVDESEQKRAFSLRIGIFNPENLENPDAAGEAGATFSENYDQSSNPAVMFDYEWQLLKMPIGKVGLRTGAGVFIAQGNGHFASAENRDKTPREIFTFWAAPVSVGAVYRLQIWDKQLFIPYGEGGGMAIPFGEFRDDSKPPKWGGAFAAYFAGGLAFNLTYFDAMSAIQLDREYGINRVYLTAEYRRILALTQNYDFSSDLVNGGLLMEF